MMQKNDILQYLPKLATYMFSLKFSTLEDNISITWRPTDKWTARPRIQDNLQRTYENEPKHLYTHRPNDCDSWN